MSPFAYTGGGQPSPTTEADRARRIREHAGKLAKVQGIGAIIETCFIDDLIEEVKVQPHGYLSALCKEFNLTSSTISSYMSAARFYTKEERQSVDPESNYAMTVWKTAYELSETDNSAGLPKAIVLRTVKDFVTALDSGALYYDDEHSKGIPPTPSNLKGKLRDEWEFYTGGLEPAVAREFYPALDITSEVGNAVCEAVGIAEKPLLDDERYDNFVKMVFIRRRKKGTDQ